MKKVIVLVCANNTAKETSICMRGKKTKIVIADNSVKKCKRKINGIKPILVSDAVVLYPKAQYMVMAQEYFQEIRSQLVEAGIDEKQIGYIDIYDLISMKHARQKQWVTEDLSYIYHNPKRKLYFFERVFCVFLCLKYDLYRKLQRNHMERKKHYVSLCSIFKNEAIYFDEWIKFHQMIGVDHFYLYNNNSEDDYKSVLNKYIDEGVVTLIEWPQLHSQLLAYKDCLQKYSDETNWIGFVDLDEFVTPLKYDKIGEFFSQYEIHGSIWIPWLIFGSSNIDERDNSEYVTKTFYKCWKKHSNTGKCFVNTSFEVDEKQNSLFHHFLWSRKKEGGGSTPPINVFGHSILENYFRPDKNEFPIEIKHYVTKSKGEYMKKIGGTDVFFANNPHSMKAFDFHDSRCCVENRSMFLYFDKMGK